MAALHAEAEAVRYALIAGREDVASLCAGAFPSKLAPTFAAVQFVVVGGSGETFVEAPILAKKAKDLAKIVADAPCVLFSSARLQELHAAGWGDLDPANAHFLVEQAADAGEPAAATLHELGSTGSAGLVPPAEADFETALSWMREILLFTLSVADLAAREAPGQDRGLETEHPEDFAFEDLPAGGDELSAFLLESYQGLGKRRGELRGGRPFGGLSSDDALLDRLLAAEAELARTILIHEPARAQAAEMGLLDGVIAAAAVDAAARHEERRRSALCRDIAARLAVIEAGEAPPASLAEVLPD